MSWKKVALSTAALAVLAAFPWGPLFAWSPVHPGYREERFARADVLYPEGSVLDPEYREIDRDIALAEAFHEWKCTRRIEVVVCGTWGDCLRFAGPFLGAQRPLAVTVATGTVIFVTPYTTGGVDAGGVLRHELSHAVIGQNRSMLSVYRMLDQPWVSEGVPGVVAAMGPVAPGRALLSMPPAGFLSRARSEDLWPCFAAAPQADFRFSYTAWMYFWARQIDRGGKPEFVRFERGCIADPDGCRRTFASVYGSDLQETVKDFQTEVRAGQLAPIPARQAPP